MKFTRIEKFNNNYFLDYSNCHHTEILYHFFTDNYRSDKNYIKNTILNDNDKNSLSGNLIEVFYDKLNKIYTFEDILYEGDFAENQLTLTKNEFLKIINRWDELTQNQPDQIIIAQNADETFTLTGKFADGTEI